MFVAGGLMWLNMTERWVDGGAAYGWPFCAIRPWFGGKWVNKDGFMFNEPTRYFYDERMLVLDASIALLLIATMCYVCEWFIRRRLARKEA